jgi:hypothetical protein
MAGALAPTPRVEEDPIATIVTGSLAAIRDAERSSVACIAESPGEVAQLAGSLTEPAGVSGSPSVGAPDIRAATNAAISSPVL